MEVSVSKEREPASGAPQGARRATGGAPEERGAAGAKKNCEIGVGFSFAAFRSSGFAGPRRSRLYGFHTGTHLPSPARRGSRSRELNSCFLIDYRPWAAKSEGRAFDNLIWVLPRIWCNSRRLGDRSESKRRVWQASTAQEREASTAEHLARARTKTVERTCA